MKNVTLKKLCKFRTEKSTLRSIALVSVGIKVSKIVVDDGHVKKAWRVEPFIEGGEPFEEFDVVDFSKGEWEHFEEVLREYNFDTVVHTENFSKVIIGNQKYEFKNAQCKVVEYLYKAKKSGSTDTSGHKILEYLGNSAPSDGRIDKLFRQRGNKHPALDSFLSKVPNEKNSWSLNF